MHRIVAVLMTLLTVAGLAAGQTRPAPAKYDPEALARAVAPFVDEQTLFVGHVDLARIDLEAVFNMLGKLGEDPPELDKNKSAAIRWVGDFLKAGGRDIYAVATAADDIKHDPALVVPLSAGVNERAIRGLLFSGEAEGPTSRPRPVRMGRPRQAVVIRNAAVLGSPQVLARLQAMTAIARPEVAAAFAAAGDSAAQVLVLPTDDTRKAIEQMMPVLPAEIGGGPSTAVTRGVLWAAAGVNAPPNTSLNVTIQSQNAASAEAFSRTLTQFYAGIGQIEHGWIHEYTRIYGSFPQTEKILAALTPKVAGDHLNLTLDTAATKALVTDLIGPMLASARLAARQNISASQLTTIGQGIALYKAGRKQESPPDLQALVEIKAVSEKVLKSRLTGKPYVYIRLPDSASGLLITAYDDPATQGMDKTVALFAASHVRLIPVNDEFWRMVKEAKDLSEKTYGSATTQPKSLSK